MLGNSLSKPTFRLSIECTLNLSMLAGTTTAFQSTLILIPARYRGKNEAAVRLSYLKQVSSSRAVIIGESTQSHSVLQRALTDSCQRRQVRTAECVHIRSRMFRGSISSEEFVVEEKGHFRDDIVSRDYQRVQQIFSTIASRLEQGNLRAGDDNGFPQVLQHETQRGGGVRHGICEWIPHLV